MLSAKEIIQKLNLEPHPEGGYYKRTFLSDVETQIAPPITHKRKSASSIYYLLENNDFSGFHRIKQDELWFFHSGSTLTIHDIDPEGVYTKHNLGLNFENNDKPQITIPKQHWFASEIESKTGYTLVSCVVTPAFDFDDFQMGSKSKLSKTYPDHSNLFSRLCRLD